MTKQSLESTALPHLVIEAALKKWAQAGKYSTFPVRGDSMHPFLYPGDMLFILHSSCEDAAPGELIAFRPAKTLIVHRLLRVITDGDSRFFLCKGDNCRRPDPLVSADRVVGRARVIIRGKSEIKLESPSWRTASRVIAACGRFSLVIDRWRCRIRRRFAGSSLNPICVLTYHTALKLLSLPNRALSRVLWNKSQAK